MASSKPIVTEEFRAAFVYVFTPNVRIRNGVETKKYELNMLFPKSVYPTKEDIPGLKDIIKEAVIAQWPDADKRPKGLRFPIRDGDEKEYDGYADHWYCRAASNRKPGIVDANRQPIISPEGFYSGCYARAQVNAFTYDTDGNRGVSFGLNNLQFIRDGDPFGASAGKPEDVFSDLGDGGDAAGEFGSSDDDFDI